MIAFWVAAKFSFMGTRSCIETSLLRRNNMIKAWDADGSVGTMVMAAEIALIAGQPGKKRHPPPGGGSTNGPCAGTACGRGAGRMWRWFRVG